MNKPKWAPTDVRLYSAVDLLTLSPLGYASYLVFKNGGGFDYNDTRLALGLYGLNLGLAVFTIPIIKKKQLGCVSFIIIFLKFVRNNDSLWAYVCRGIPLHVIHHLKADGTCNKV